MSRLAVKNAVSHFAGRRPRQEAEQPQGDETAAYSTGCWLAGRDEFLQSTVARVRAK